MSDMVEKINDDDGSTGNQTGHAIDKYAAFDLAVVCGSLFFILAIPVAALIFRLYAAAIMGGVLSLAAATFLVLCFFVRNKKRKAASAGGLQGEASYAAPNLTLAAVSSTLMALTVVLSILGAKENTAAVVLITVFSFFAVSALIAYFIKSYKAKILSLLLGLDFGIFSIFFIINIESKKYMPLFLVAAFMIALLLIAVFRLLNRKKRFFTTQTITRLAVFSALSIVLYLLPKLIPIFNLPFFPPFLELQFSDVPALLAGYMMGFEGGLIVLIIKTFIKLPNSGTGGIGELCDLILGAVFVLAATLIYSRNRKFSGAIISLVAGSFAVTAAAMVLNRFVIIPMYANIFLPGGWDTLLGALKGLFPKITVDNFYLYYLWLGVLPFNLMRCAISSIMTLLLYKSMKRLFEKRTVKRPHPEPAEYMESVTYIDSEVPPHSGDLQ